MAKPIAKPIYSNRIITTNNTGIGVQQVTHPVKPKRFYLYDPVFLGVEMSWQQPMAIFQGCGNDQGSPSGFTLDLAIVLHHKHWPSSWRDRDVLRLPGTMYSNTRTMHSNTRVADYPIQLSVKPPSRLVNGYMLIEATHLVKGGRWREIYPRPPENMPWEAITDEAGLRNSSLGVVITEQLMKLTEQTLDWDDKPVTAPGPNQIRVHTVDI